MRMQSKESKGVQCNGHVGNWGVRRGCDKLRRTFFEGIEVRRKVAKGQEKGVFEPKQKGALWPHRANGCIAPLEERP